MMAEMHIRIFLSSLKRREKKSGMVMALHTIE